MRRKETRPTSIYWLFDSRTNIPFYCGKTVYAPKVRLKQHLSTTNRSTTSAYIAANFNFVTIAVMDVVPPGDDWFTAERRWIVQIRAINPSALNKADGGQGISGLPRSAVTKAKISAKQKGKIISQEARAKISAVQKGRPIPETAKIKIGAALRGRARPPEVIEKIRHAQKGRPLTAEHRKALCGQKNFLGRKHTPEAREQIRLAALAQWAAYRAKKTSSCA